MIVTMKHVTVLISSRERDVGLRKLRDLGVVHIHSVKAPASEEISDLDTKMSNVDKVLMLIGDTPETGASFDEQKTIRSVTKILELAARKDTLLRELSEHQKHDRWFAEWGPVSLESLEAIRQAGMDIRFHICPKKEVRDIVGTASVHVVREVENKVYLVHFAMNDAPRLEYPEDVMPSVEVGPMRQRMQEIELAVRELDETIGGFSKEGGAFRTYRRSLLTQQEFARAKYGMGEADSIVYLEGFCPVDSVDPIKRAADSEGWGYVFRDPDDPRDVPTLIRTSRWIQMIRPVFTFMGTVPGYAEYDISIWFLLFFSLFYGMLVGDAGYGLIFLAATAGAHFKLRGNAPWEPFGLMYILSVATIIWGTISGTWFGMTGIFDIPALAFLKHLVFQPISSIGGDQNFMMFLCFFIGAVHLTIAHSLIAARSIRTLNALAQAGWILVIWGLFFVAEWLVLGRALRAVAQPLFLVGFILILLFENFQKRMFLKGALMTLANLPLSVISAFSDVVSYLRLFAVGFATFIVASSFNQMAADAGTGLFGGLIAAVILFLGHSINIILAVMAVVVHGIRLNMLEFSGHLNMQWSGKPYQPFSTSLK